MCVNQSHVFFFVHRVWESVSDVFHSVCESSCVWINLRHVLFISVWIILRCVNHHESQMCSTQCVNYSQMCRSSWISGVFYSSVCVISLSVCDQSQMCFGHRVWINLRCVLFIMCVSLKCLVHQVCIASEVLEVFRNGWIAWFFEKGSEGTYPSVHWSQMCHSSRVLVSNLCDSIPRTSNIWWAVLHINKSAQLPVWQGGRKLPQVRCGGCRIEWGQKDSPIQTRWDITQNT